MKYFEPSTQNYENFNYYEINLIEETDVARGVIELAVPWFEFENNELFQLILCYLNEVYDSSYEIYKFSHGYNFKQDINFPWLASYLETNHMLLYGKNEPAHSIIYVERITHFYKNTYEVILLKSFKDFNSDELIKRMNTLYNLGNHEIIRI